MRSFIISFFLFSGLIANASDADSIRLYRKMLQGEELAFSKPDSALFYLNTCLNLLEEFEKKGQEKREWHLHLRATLYNDIAFLTQRKGDLNKAIRVYQLALDLLDEKKDRKNTTPLKSNLANLYLLVGNLKKAKKLGEEALNDFREERDLAGVINCNNLLGNIEQKKGNHQGADAYYRLGIELGKESPLVQSNVMRSYELLGRSQYDQKQYREAEENFQQALELSGAAVQSTSLFNVFYYMSKLELVKNDLEKAGALADSAYAYSKVLNYPGELNMATALLSDIWYRKGDFKKSIEFLKISNALRDSFNNEESANQINLLESDKKEIQFELNRVKSEEKIKNQRYLIAAGVVFILLFAVLLLLTFRNYLNKKKSHQEIEQKNKIIEEKQNDIISSIHYAKRIQQGLLPTEKHIEKKLKDLMK